MLKAKNVLLATSFLLFSCGGDKSDDKDPPANDPPKDTPVESSEKKTVTDITAAITLEIADGPMKGTQANFPAGSVALGDVLEIAVVTEQPAEMAAVFAAGSTQASPAGIGLSVTNESGEAKNLALPGTLSIVLNEGIALTADATKENVGVLTKRADGTLVAYLAKYAKPKDDAKVSSVPFVDPGTFTAAFIGNEAPEGYKVYDMEGPTVTTDAITATEVTTTSMTLTWTKATDDSTAQAELWYKVVTSASDNISTVADALANGTMIKDWTKDINTIDVADLTAGTTYHFNVLVRDGEEDKEDRTTAYKSLAQATSEDVVPTGPLRMFVTSGTWEGNLGGKLGADQKCTADASKPAGTSKWKAFLVQAGAREACSVANCAAGSVSIDWVLQANTQYIRASDDAVIGTANAAGIFDFPLTSAVDVDDAFIYWTGFSSATDWTVGANTCNDWVEDIAGNGDRGQPDPSSVTLNFGTIGCGNFQHLLCVEQ